MRSLDRRDFRCQRTCNCPLLRIRACLVFESSTAQRHAPGLDQSQTQNDGAPPQHSMYCMCRRCCAHIVCMPLVPCVVPAAAARPTRLLGAPSVPRCGVRNRAIAGVLHTPSGAPIHPYSTAGNAGQPRARAGDQRHLEVLSHAHVPPPRRCRRQPNEFPRSRRDAVGRHQIRKEEQLRRLRERRRVGVAVCGAPWGTRQRACLHRHRQRRRRRRDGEGVAAARVRRVGRGHGPRGAPAPGARAHGRRVAARVRRAAAAPTRTGRPPRSPAARARRVPAPAGEC